MGSPICDLLAEVTQGDMLEKRNTALLEVLCKETESGNILSANVLRRVRLQAVNNQGEPIGVIMR